MNSTTSSHGRQKSGRLITTTPSTTIGTSLLDIKSEIHPNFFDGVSILKVSSKGTLVPRIITISDDLFTVFISHDKVTKERLKSRIKYKGYKAYSKFVSTVVGHSAQTHRDIRVIDICDILFVQSGFIGSQKLEAVASKMKINASRVVSIFYHDTGIDFLMKNEDERKSLLKAIDIIRSKYHECKTMLGRERKLLRYIWYDTDWDKSGMIAQSEFLHLLVRINLYIKTEFACRLFNEVANTTHGSPRSKSPEITFNQCIDLLRKIKREYFNGNEMRDYIFDSVFGEDKDKVTAEEFLTLFLHGAQNEVGVTINEAKRIFSDLNRMEILRAHHEDTEHDNHITIDRLLFEEYLMSSQNDVYDPKRREFDPQSLNEPISHYWINTSHNTYLTGDQLRSYSSVEMYSLALHSGCKCLELDCWDDTTAEIPVVYHGYTLTSKIPFQDIITAVKFYIINNPGLPIILSLENHCSPIYQRTMATILKTTLEDLLYVPGRSSVLPTPNELIGKVVIKGKRPPEKEDLDEMTESSRALGVEKVEIDKSSTQSVTIVEDLANLTLLNGVSFKNFDTSMQMSSTDMHSFSETKITRVLKSPENAARWREYNRDHMSRTYPSGSRVDSSNAEPLVAWAAGCQLVAMNFQTHDAALGLNDGRFRENGGCGYVRKPDSLLTPNSEQRTFGKDIMLNIRVLSGTCLPKPKAEKFGEIIDPYVVVRVDDVALDAECDPIEGSLRKDLLDRYKYERRTDDVRDNGYCPQWNSGLYSFPVKSPDIAMVSFNVIYADAGFLENTMCKATIPVSCLREGFRSVHFYDQCNLQHGPFEFASILIEIEIKPMPMTREDTTSADTNARLKGDT